MLRLQLTCDLGNSALKLRLWEPASEAPRATLELPVSDAEAEALADGLNRFLDAELPAGAEVSSALSSVAGAAHTDAVATSLETRGSLTSAPPIANLCRNPESVGADRLWAARGALDLVSASCIVVDAGTALTVDAVVPSGPGEPTAGDFLGGAIAPGPALLARALGERGARLPEFEAAPDVPALGRDTLSALRSGIAVGFRGSAAELARCVALEAGLADGAPRNLAGVAVVLTGGAREFLLRPAPFVSADLRVVPDLVHAGLWYAVATAAR